MVFQSIHSYEHLISQIFEKQLICKKSSQPQLTKNQHFEKCFVCEIGFSSFTKPSFYSFQTKQIFRIPNQVIICLKKTTSFFIGSLFGLRAPPIV
jgi:hypothetical protein